MCVCVCDLIVRNRLHDNTVQSKLLHSDHISKLLLNVTTTEREVRSDRLSQITGQSQLFVQVI